MAKTVAVSSPVVERRRLAFFERYLSLWVGLCMVAGVAFGKLIPSAVQSLRGLEFGHGSQINVPIAVLIWLMITPMMMKVDFGAIRNVGRKPRGLVVTLLVNWLVKPFSMAFLAWLFFRFVFAAFISPPKRINTSPGASSLLPHRVQPCFSCGATSRMVIRRTRWSKSR